LDYFSDQNAADKLDALLRNIDKYDDAFRGNNVVSIYHAKLKRELAIADFRVLTNRDKRALSQAAYESVKLASEISKAYVRIASGVGRKVGQIIAAVRLINGLSNIDLEGVSNE